MAIHQDSKQQALLHEAELGRFPNVEVTAA